MVIAVLGSSTAVCSALMHAVRSLPASVRGVSGDGQVACIELEVGPREALKHGSAHLVETFRSVSAALDRQCMEFIASEIDELTVIAESISLDTAELNPLAEAGGWSALVSMLVLAFPDVHWCFVEVRPPKRDDSPGSRPDDLHSLELLHGLDSLGDRVPAYSNLFDGSGLKGRIRESIIDGELRPVLRKRLCVAVDDERQFAQFNALVGYRHGYRCFAVDSFTLARHVLGKDEPLGRHFAGKIDLSIEDLNLRFADHAQGTRLSCARSRLEVLGVLAGVDALVLLTAADERQAREHLAHREKRAEGTPRHRRFRSASKPIGGVNVRDWGFSLLERDRSEQSLEVGFSEPPYPVVNWPGWMLPLQRWVPWLSAPSAFERACFEGACPREAGDRVSEPHSAPGRMVEVANVLLARARAFGRLSDEQRSPLPAIRAAVLALDAKELLRNKTPTTCITAIELRHEAELRAEFHFAGVVLSPEGIRVRIREIHREVDAVFGWDRRADGKRPCGSLVRAFRHAWDEFCAFWTLESMRRDLALGGIVSRLLAALDGQHQLEAELEFLKEDRRLQNRIRWYQRTARPLIHVGIDANPTLSLGAVTGLATKIVALGEFLGMRYVNWLLQGPLRLAIASAFWLALLSWPLTLSRMPRDPAVDADRVGEVIHAMQYSIFTFLGIGQPNVTASGIEHIGWFLAVTALMLVGLLHVGILISQVYSFASRR